jgi:sugar phosphate isomerase/epimerase
MRTPATEMPIALGLTPDGRWQIDVDTFLAASGDAGFRTVGLSANWATVDAAGGLTARGMRCHELLSLRMSGAEDVVAQAERLASAASTVGAEWILTGGFRGPVTSEMCAQLARAADIVAEAGSKLAIEFSPAGSVRSIRDAVAMLDASGARDAGVLIDTWHFFHGTSTWDELETVPLEKIAYLQFQDALAPASADGVDETMNRRAMPGDGVLDLDRFATTLLERGWEGVVGIEVLSSELNQLPVAEFARRAYASAARYWL